MIQEEFIPEPEKLLNNAASYIRELFTTMGKDETSLCDELFKYPEEEKICAAYCQNFCNECVIRYLKHYK